MIRSPIKHQRGVGTVATVPTLYQGGQQIEVAHPTFQAGDNCPVCQQGTLYQKAPRVLVRVNGQTPLNARVYRMQRLRCHRCGKVFAADPPTNIGRQKHDATAASMTASPTLVSTSCR